MKKPLILGLAALTFILLGVGILVFGSGGGESSTSGLKIPIPSFHSKTPQEKFNNAVTKYCTSKYGNARGDGGGSQYSICHTTLAKICDSSNGDSRDRCYSTYSNTRALASKDPLKDSGGQTTRQTASSGGGGSGGSGSSTADKGATDGKAPDTPSDNVRQFSKPKAEATLASTECKGDNQVKVSGALGLGECVGSDSKNPIFDLINKGIQVAIIALGVIFVLMIVIAGLQYVVSGTSADAAKSAKDRIKNAVTGMVLLALMYGLLQLILPSGSKVFQ